MRATSRLRHSAAAGLIASLLLSLVAFAPPAVFAAGVVGDGTPGSCTDAALTSALSGGGLVTFNCGPSPVTIVISEKTISDDTTIDGGGLVTLSGNDTNRLFDL